jgi:hypothetical protein
VTEKLLPIDGTGMHVKALKTEGALQIERVGIVVQT